MSCMRRAVNQSSFPVNRNLKDLLHALMEKFFTTPFQPTQMHCPRHVRFLWESLLPHTMHVLRTGTAAALTSSKGGDLCIVSVGSRRRPFPQDQHLQLAVAPASCGVSGGCCSGGGGVPSGVLASLLAVPFSRPGAGRGVIGVRMCTWRSEHLEEASAHRCDPCA